MANDPYWNSVVLAMHMDDVGLTDVKGHTITRVGTAARSAAQSKFGGYSALFNAATPNQGNRLSVTGTLTDFSFSGDFTVEFYMYPTAFGASWGSYVVDTRNTSVANGTGWYISYGYASSGNKLSVYDGTTDIATTFVPPLNAWSHVAVVRASGVISVYANGALVNTPVSNSATIPCSQFLIGSAGNAASTTGIAGYIDDLRITKGVARYTANFSVPTEAFPNRPMQLSGTVKDSSGNFAARTVRAYKRSTGALSDSDTSSASDGAFTLDAADGTAHYVICFDDDLNENALIFDNLIPV